MSRNKNSFLHYLQKHLSRSQQLVDHIGPFLYENYGMSDITIFKHLQAPDCYKPIGSEKTDEIFRKTLMESKPRNNAVNPGIVEIDDLYVFPLSDQNKIVQYVLIISGDKKKIEEIPSYTWGEIESIYKLAIASEEINQERLWGKAIQIVSRMAHDLNSLAALIPVGDKKDQTLAERIQYSEKLSEEILLYLRDFSLRYLNYASREVFDGIFSEFDPPSGIDYRINFEDNLKYVNVDLELIELASIAILKNAVTACQIEGSRIDITISREQNKSIFVNHDWLAISIKDNGPGIPHEFLSDVIKPLYTTWKEQGHIGLGLSIANKIIQNHRGSLEIKSQAGKGTEISFYLPLHDAKI